MIDLNFVGQLWVCMMYGYISFQSSFHQFRSKWVHFEFLLFWALQIQQVSGRKFHHLYVVSWHKRKVLDLVVTIAHGHYCNNNKQKPSYLIEIQVWNKIFAQKDAMDIENHDEYINSLFAFVFEGVLLLPSAWLIQSWTLYFFWT